MDLGVGRSTVYRALERAAGDSLSASKVVEGDATGLRHDVRERGEPSNHAGT